MLTLQRLTIRPGESLLYTMDFVHLMETGETISSVTSFAVSPSGPTVGTFAFSGARAQARVSGVTAGQLYHVRVEVVTSLGNTRVECGELLAEDC